MRVRPVRAPRLGAARLVAVWLLAVCGACGREVPVYDRAPFSRDPPGLGALAGRILTSNSGDDSLSVVARDGTGPVGRLPVGFSPVELEGPHHIAADPGGRYIYVNLSLSVQGAGSGPHGAHGTGSQPGWVLKLDARDGRLLASVQVDRSPGDNVLSQDGRTLFVTHYDLVAWSKAAQIGDLRAGDSSLLAIDTERMSVIRRVPLCPAAHAVRLSADGATLYASCGPDEIAIVDLRAPTWPVRRVLLPDHREAASCKRCPYGLGIAPDGTVWVSSLGVSHEHGGLDVFDPGLPGGGAFDPARSRTLHGAAMFPAFIAAPDGYRVVVPEQHLEGRLQVYDPKGRGEASQLVQTIELSPQDCLSPHMMLTTGAGERTPLVCEGDHAGPGSLVWLDLTTGAVLGVQPIGVFPDGLVALPGPR